MCLAVPTPSSGLCQALPRGCVAQAEPGERVLPLHHLGSALAYPGFSATGCFQI